MPSLSFNKVSFSYGMFDILKDASFMIRERSKAGLVGRNGSGKTTIIKLLMGEITPNSGEIVKTRDMKIGYVAQELKDEKNELQLIEYIKSDFSELFKLEAKINELEHEISRYGHGNENSPAYRALMEDYSRSVELFERQDGYAFMSRMRSVLAGLGFRPDEHEKPLAKFSGGMKTRAQLCKLLLKEYDLIVLDEPTNYLDTASLEFLENFLKNAPVAALIISHDRYFLDAVCDHILYLYNSQIEEFPGNYTDFSQIFEVRQEQRIMEYEKQQEFIKKTEEFYEKYKAGIKCKMARGRKKFIDRMERLKDPAIYQRNVKLDFSANMGAESGRVVISAAGLKKSFGARTLFEDGAFEIMRGSITGVIGANGTGKTTLLKMILGSDENYSGVVKVGHNVSFGYQDQLLTGLDPENRVIDEIWNMKKMMTEGEVRNYLAAFMFTGEDVFKKVKALSGGEKSRLILSKIIMTGANTLILDEPTNHLDIESREMLESALSNFEGSVIFVSHDRYFIDNVADGLILVADGKLKYYNGNYSYYKERTAEVSGMKIGDSGNTGGGNKGAKSMPEKIDQAGDEASKKTLSKNAGRQLKSEIDRTEAEIVTIENRIREIEEIFSRNHIDGKPLTFDQTEKLNGEYMGHKEQSDALYKKLEELYARM